MDRDGTDAVAEAMHLLADVTRLKILLTLAEGESDVTGLCRRLGRPQPTVSHHLAILRGSRVVLARRDGRQIFYRLSVHSPRPRGIHVAADGSFITVEMARPAITAAATGPSGG
jgi:DNA-binding transcriptional ArsR family regulator